MRGKKYHIDKATGKLVECQSPNEIQLLPAGPEVKPYDQTELEKWAVPGITAAAIIGVPAAPTPEKQLENLRAVLDKADEESERFADRHDTLRVQQFVQVMREHYLNQ